MSAEPFNIVLTQQAKLSLAAIKDKRHQSLLIQRIQQLRIEPEKQGKALVQDLKGYRSIRAVGQRYRIVYTYRGPKNFSSGRSGWLTEKRSQT